ncbi:MAG: SBBP repeat-containing protein, partial [Planctomycetota bacterium]|nr:SBBP repeat-containing protein [Planctomycetota bacterium]
AKLSPSGELLWSTYLGGSGDDQGGSIAVDGSGNVLVTGYTSSSGWTSSGFDTSFNGGHDAFVAKLSPSGGHLWSTYLGGNSYDYGYGIAVDGSGNVLVTGRTVSSGWTSGGFDTSYNWNGDAFVAKLSPSGAHLWSTYLGGIDTDEGYGIAVDGAGNVLMTGRTVSSGWTSGGFDTSFNGDRDAFVAKLSPSGELLWSTYLGGNGGDDGTGIAVDGSGNVLVTGSTNFSGWTSGGFDTSFNGISDAFVAKLSPSGGHLWSTYLGGSGDDQGGSIAVDGSGNVLVTGTTESSGWTSGGFDTSYNGGWDAFVVKISGADDLANMIAAAGDMVVTVSDSRDLARLHVAGQARVEVAAGAHAVVRAEDLYVGGEGVLDVNDNELIVGNSSVEVIGGLIRAGRADGKWNGVGIRSSAAKGKAFTGLGVGVNDGGEVLVKYTWDGDANLDGIVNADDYFLADSGYITQKGGWGNGDFNYDGVINADDYFLIDSAFIGQSGPLAASKPEPAVSADVAVQQKAKKAEPGSILSQLFSTGPLL